MYISRVIPKLVSFRLAWEPFLCLLLLNSLIPQYITIITFILLFNLLSWLISSVQLLSCVWLFATPWMAAQQASLSIINSRVHPNSCPLSRWCHPPISSSDVPFSSCPQPLPASGSFQMSQLFSSGGQSIGVSASTSVLRMNTQDWSPLGWTDWISLPVQGILKSFLQHHSSKYQFFGAQLSL